MDSFEWNKVAGAVISGLLLFMVVTLVTESFFGGEEEVVIGPESEATPGSETTPETSEPKTNFMALIVNANASLGERSFRKCQACHTDNDGGADRVGPNLYEVVGRPVASKEGYAYSPALSAKGGTWDYDALNTFLAGPQADIPGTKMTFAGLPKDDERANVIAYLRLQSANPLPLPEVPAEEPAQEQAEETAPAEGS